MEHVWKCDFCRDTDKEPSIIEKHEAACSFNPANGDCPTCRNWMRIPYEQGYYCKLGMETEELNEDTEGPCPKWVLE